MSCFVSPEDKVGREPLFLPVHSAMQSHRGFPREKEALDAADFPREIRNGDRSVSEVLKLSVLWSWQRLLRVVHGEQWLRGPHKRTPTMSLNLKPGERSSH